MTFNTKEQGRHIIGIKDNPLYWINLTFGKKKSYISNFLMEKMLIMIPFVLLVFPAHSI